ncbi:transposase ISL3 family protein [Pseudomonas sp. LP_7_YM]|nr:transposase ISL3 family protein [Pseudomonas sp. LP_7_YM]
MHLSLSTPPWCHYSCRLSGFFLKKHIRDLPILGRAVRLNVLLRRVGCRDCGKRMENVSWLDRYAHMTQRLAEAVIQACERLPASHVAQMFGLHWVGRPFGCWSVEPCKRR